VSYVGGLIGMGVMGIHQTPNTVRNTEGNANREMNIQHYLIARFYFPHKRN